MPLLFRFHILISARHNADALFECTPICDPVVELGSHTNALS